MVVHAVKEGDNLGERRHHDWSENAEARHKMFTHRVVSERPLNLVGVPLIQTELAVSPGVVGVVAGTLVILVFHEVEVPEGEGA